MFAHGELPHSAPSNSAPPKSSVSLTLRNQYGCNAGQKIHAAVVIPTFRPLSAIDAGSLAIGPFVEHVWTRVYARRAATMYAHCFFAHIALKMARPLSLAQHTLFADLLEQGDVDLFDPDLPENGSILVRRGATNALSAHVYYQGYRPSARKADPGQRFARYLGRTDDPAITTRIAKFQSIKAVRAERITTVRALIGAGMPRPDRISGRIIEALARAALFREDAVLLGQAAYQTYNGVLGVRLSAPKRPTSDRATVAIAVRDGDRLNYVLDVLRTIDPSFTAEAGATATYRSANGIGIAVTVAGRGENLSDATGFLIARAVRALVLHGPGIPVAVPAPERYVASAQFGQTLLTAEEIAELTDGLVLAGRDRVLAEAFAEAVAGHPAS